MTNFNNNIPQPNDLLSDSQGVLLTNNQALDATFLIDHYTFSDNTANSGKHNTVTTPIITGSAHPTTSATELKLYAMQDLAAIGLLQYSRGTSDATPTPITEFQGPLAGSVVLNAANLSLIDLTGITRAVGTVYIGARSTLNVNYVNSCNFFFSNGTYTLINTTSTFFPVSSSGAVLRLTNSLIIGDATVFWSIDFHRITV